MAEKFNAEFLRHLRHRDPGAVPRRSRTGTGICLPLATGQEEHPRQRQWITLRFFRFRVAAIVIAGIAGEPIALWALYRESETPWQRPTVLVATLILLLAVAAAPIGAYADQLAQFLDQALEGPPERAKPGENEAPGDQHAEQPRQQ